MDLKTLNRILAFEIKDFPNYFAGNDGNIYSEKGVKKSGEMLCLRATLGNHGYYQVVLYKNGKRYLKLVHRLIAQMFIPNPKGFLCVDHKNGDRTDNSLENLRWVSYKDNNRNQHVIAKDNSSGIQGVSFNRKGNSWVAQWNDNNKLQVKSFSINKYDNAKHLAIAYRKKMVDKFYNRP